MCVCACVCVCCGNRHLFSREITARVVDRRCEVLEEVTGREGGCVRSVARSLASLLIFVVTVAHTRNGSSRILERAS